MPKSQAVYPFTRFDQVNALAGASEDAPKRDPANLRSHRGHGIDTWEEVQRHDRRDKCKTKLDMG